VLLQDTSYIIQSVADGSGFRIYYFRV